MYIAEMRKYDYQMWVRRVQWFTGNSRYWETTGPCTPDPYGVAAGEAAMFFNIVGRAVWKALAISTLL